MRNGLALFLRANIYDFLMVGVLTVALSYAVLSGFDAALDLRFRFDLQALVAGGVLLVLYAGSWSRKARALSIVGTIVYCLVVIGAALALSPEESPAFAEGAVNDVEGNYAIFAVVVLACAVLSYVLSRSLGGAVVLAVSGAFCCCVVQFLFREWLGSEGGLVDFVVVLVCAVALVVYRRYRTGLAKADVREGTAFGGTALVGVVAAAASLGVAAVVFVGVIAPLGLGTPILKPFESYIVPPIVEYTGTYDEFLVEDPDRPTSLLNEREDSTTQNTEGGSVPDEEETPAPQSPILSFLQSTTLFSSDDWTESFDAVTMDRLTLGLLVVVLIVALLVAALIAARIFWREVRLRRLDGKSSADQVVFLYHFLLSRFKKLGLGKPETSTPLEFAYDSRRNLVPFTRGTGQVDFVKVTLIFQRAAYGSGSVTEEDCECVRRYYRAFFANAHQYVGTPRWLFKFWRV